MKRIISLFLLVALLCLLVTALAAPILSLVPAEPAEDADVMAVFAQKNKQPFTMEDGRTQNLDSIWIYFTDGTFAQFALIDDKPVLFSKGNFHFENGGDFLYDPAKTDFGDVVIVRTAKFNDKEGLVPYESEHKYALNTLGFKELFADKEKGKKVVALFAGPGKQPFQDGMIDTFWTFYTDGTFDQFAVVGMGPMQFSEGTYELSDGADFRFGEDETDFGKITIRRTKKFQPGKNYADYDSEHTYELNSLGFSLLVLDEK